MPRRNGDTSCGRARELESSSPSCTSSWPSTTTSPCLSSRSKIVVSIHQRRLDDHYFSHEHMVRQAQTDIRRGATDGGGAATSIQQHYSGHSVTSYESNFFYSSGAYMSFLNELVQDTFQWKDNCRDNEGVTLLDVGGGTGTFATMLLEGNPSINAIVMEPFLEKADSATCQPSLRFIKASANEFMIKSMSKQHDLSYHQVLMKEMVHHLQANHRVNIFRGIREGISHHAALHEKAPALLILTRPKYDIDYPLWPAAKEAWAANQPSHQSIQHDLLDAGFRRVVVTSHAYPCSIALTTWKSMVQNRFWSTFSSFSDEALKEACHGFDSFELHDGKLHFEDRMLFISAYMN